MTSSLLFRLSDNNPQSEEDYSWWETDVREMFIFELGLLFTSRIRQPEIEDIHQVNESVLNYGIDESFRQVTDIIARCRVMEQRLLNALSRFEPRLTQVSITSEVEDSSFMQFTLSAYYMQAPVSIGLKWNDCTGRFYFNE